MNTKYLRDERGVAMVLELVLVGAVLALVGLALYQSAQHPKPTAAKPAAQTAAAGAVNIADSAAAIGVVEAASDGSIGAAAEASADQIDDADVDVTNLGGSAGENAL